MLEFSRTQVINFAAHYVGNKGLGEPIKLSDKPYEFTDDFTKEIILRYLVSRFKDDAYYHFSKVNNVTLDSPYQLVEDVFAKRRDFIDFSTRMANKLHNESMHPRIKGGELYFVYFRDLIIDGELCDGIGIFKSETKDNFVKVQHDDVGVYIEVDLGINIDKLDKGCIIFNTEKDTGYKAMIVDNSHKIAETGLYWINDFLGMELKPSAYLSTSRFIDECIGFCGEILNEANNVPRIEQMKYLNNSVKYLKEHHNINVKDFEREVLEKPDVIDAFKEYREVQNKINQNPEVEEVFEVSKTAVKQNNKYLKSVLKLDKNYQIHITGRHEIIENGYDEEKGMKFYKLYYINEE